MSDHQKENALRIAAFLENRLSPEEREAFKRSLAEDDELRLQYVDALMNKAGSGPKPDGMGETVSGVGETEGVGETVSGVGETEGVGETTIGEREEAGQESEWETLGEHGAREAWEAGWPGGKKRAGGGFLGSGWMVGTAVLLMIIAGAVIFILIRHQEFWDRTVAAAVVDSGNAKRRMGIDSAVTGAAADSGTAGRGAGAGTAVVSAAGGQVALADSIYARLYKPYMRGDDPVAVRVYYQDYRTGNYAAVLAAGDSVMTAAGSGPRQLQIKDYMRLYKGLAYLATGDGREAVTELGGVALRTKPGDEMYEAARWYLALAWLRRNDVDLAEARGKALGLARDISHSYSRYREPARALIRALGL
jgi:hypothetical protein